TTGHRPRWPRSWGCRTSPSPTTKPSGRSPCGPRRWPTCWSEFILNQDWNDPKSQLQQCCLTLRTEGKEPDIPLYKTLQTVGPSHARTYTVAVYFKGERIGCGKGPSIQQAEMGAAMDALEKC
uniref:DRBM domain-containing protein n=1 Tax=Amphiprion ocellaris TaxID=80972 RepID=A0AAQ6AHR9_AMPOC